MGRRHTWHHADEAQSHFRAPKQCFYSESKDQICSLSLSMSPFLFLCLSHSHWFTHMRTLTVSLSLLSVQLASGLHFPLEPVKGGALLCELG